MEKLKNPSVRNQFIKYKIIAYNQERVMLPIETNNQIIDQIQKLVQRIGQLKETKNKFYQYLFKIEEVYIGHSQLVKNHFQNFQGVILQKSFYSINKCQSMKRLTNIYKQLCTFVQNLSNLNLDELKKVNIDTSKYQQKLNKKSDNFIKSLHEYSRNQESYNKQYADYQQQCSKLDDAVKKCKTLEEPIKFYNINAISGFSKNLDGIYHNIQNKQGQLASSLQVLDHTRKNLTQNLKDIKQDYLMLIHFHMANIYSAASCLVDESKDQMNNIQILGPMDKIEGDVFRHQIQSFSDRYSKNNNSHEDQIFTDLKDLFANNQDIKISSDERLFIDRCETLIQKKYDSIQQFIDLQKKLVEEIKTQVSNNQKLNKQLSAVQKSLFKSNVRDTLKKNIQKYFGEGTSNIVELCYLIIDGPRKHFDKISKNFQAHQGKLQKVLQRKQEQYKKLKKWISQIIYNQSNSYKEVQNNKLSVSQFKTNIQKTFTLFKASFQKLTKSENAYDLQFQSTLRIYIQFISRQSVHIRMKYTLNKQRQKLLFNLYKIFNSDSQIIQIVKQDTLYQVLFADSLKPTLFSQFASLINKKGYKQTEKVIQRKQTNMRGILGYKEPGCCGLLMGRVYKYSKIKSFTASLIDLKQLSRPGQLQILNKGLMFKEKNKNPFGNKIDIIIPTKQIMSFSHKILYQGQTAIQIMTSMGPLLFLSQNYPQIEESLEKNLGAKLMTKDNSKHEKSSQNSSFFKQNSFMTTQFKVSFEKSIISPPEIKTNFLNKNNKLNSSLPNSEPIANKKFIQNWKKTKILSKYFVIESSQQSGNIVRNDYKYQDEINKFLLREKRVMKQANLPQKGFILNYQWKISFPYMPMLKSFVHGQQVKIQSAQNIVNIKIVQANRGDSHLYVRKTFYNQITKMNQTLLPNLVVAAFQKQALVNIEQQPQSQESSTLLLDLQNLAIQKQEVQNKHDKLVKRQSSILGGQNEKGNSRLTMKGQ